MAQNGNTSQDKKPGQAQSPELQDSAKQADEPGSIKPEPPRICKVCGSPNHHGCGCEARELAHAKSSDAEAPAEKSPEIHKTVGMIETKAHADGQKLPTIHFDKDGEPLCDAKKSTDEYYTASEYEITCPDCQQLLKTKPAEMQTPAENKFQKIVKAMLSKYPPEEIETILKGQVDFAKDIKTIADSIETLCACFCDTNEHLKWLRESKDLNIIISYLSNIDQNLKELLKEYKEYQLLAEPQETQDAPENKN